MNIILVLFYVLIGIITILLLSSIRIKIDYLKLKKNNDLKVSFYLYLFNKIPYFKLEKNINTKKALKNINSQEISKTLKIDKDYKKIIKKLKFKIENFKLLLNVGFLSINTTNAIIFSILTIVSTILGFLSSREIVEFKNIKYKILPSYNKDLLEIDFNCIISIKIVHIIYIIFLLLKERVKAYVRASNRRFNVRSYE